MPHVEAAHHLPLRPGTNVAVLTALAHVIVTEGLVDEDFVRERCDWEAFQDWARFVAEDAQQPRGGGEGQRRAGGDDPRRGAAVSPSARNGAIYYGLGVTEHSQGSTAVMALANLAMATGNIGRPGVGVNPLRGQNNVQGSCDMGSLPARAARLSPHLRSRGARDLRARMGRDARSGAGPAHSQHDRRRAGWLVPGHLHPGRGHRAVRPRYQAHHRRSRGDGMRGGARPVPERDSELRARVPAGLHVPGEGRHVHQRRAPHQPGAQGDGAARRHARTGR